MNTRASKESTNPPKIAYLLRSDSPDPSRHEILEVICLGRDPSNQVVIDDPFVSARHARVEHRDEGFFVRDLRSRNGTWLNGVRVVEARLQEGDRIVMGSAHFQFSSIKEPKGPQLQLTSRNSEWEARLRRIPNIALSGLPVLITGPSGSGKELVANAVHRYSHRSRGPFVCVNCSALNETLIESELFGHVRGSFTGATHNRSGAFEAARGGTLFLDEIGDLPLNLQPKLLRALENSEIRPVGSDRTIQTDVRIVAATHQDLRQKVSQGGFRSDLYFRLSVVPFLSAPLAMRLEDFEDLLSGFCREYQIHFSERAISILKEHPWPGNVRELKNLVARARAHLGGPETVQPEHLAALLEPLTSPQPRPRSLDIPSRRGQGIPMLKEVELALIQERLVANRGNQRKTAIELGLAKSTLHDRLRDYGINIESLLAEKHRAF